MTYRGHIILHIALDSKSSSILGDKDILFDSYISYILLCFRVEFVDEMLTYRNDLEEINISLLDLMVPLPGTNRSSLFNKLWKCFTDPQTTARYFIIIVIKIN